MNCFTTLSVCFLLIFTKCFVETHVLTMPGSFREARIVGGQQAKPHSHPYMVSLQLRFLWIRAHICGGSIINEKWVLTAAHCVSHSFLIRWLNMDVVAGAHDVDYYGPKAQVSKVIERIPHPDYKGGVGPNDVAVLKIEDKFVFSNEIKPINLPLNEMQMNNLMLPGWGVLRTTVFIPDLPSKLQELKVTYVPFEKCNENIERLLENGEDNPLVEEANVCTGPLGGGKAACSGDSGGPLVLRVPCPVKEMSNNENVAENNTTNESNNNKEETKDIVQSKAEKCFKHSGGNEQFIPYIVGIVSWGISPCGEEGAPTVFTNVTHYVDFINSHVLT